MYSLVAKSVRTWPLLNMLQSTIIAFAMAIEVLAFRTCKSWVGRREMQDREEPGKSTVQ